MTIGNFFKYFRKAIRIFTVKFKPLTVHTEAIFYDDVWNIIKEKMRKKEIHTWYIMTPINYYDIKHYFWLKESKKEIEHKMINRYIKMKKNGERIQLHVHLHPLIKMAFKDQEQLIANSINWMKKEIGISPTEIVFGWFRHNEDSEIICKKYNLKIISFNEYNSIHDFDWIIDCKGEVKL